MAYDITSRRFSLLADKCILSSKSIVSKILLRMSLPNVRTKVDSDPHYRCYRCLGRDS